MRTTTGNTQTITEGVVYQITMETLSKFKHIREFIEEQDLFEHENLDEDGNNMFIFEEDGTLVYYFKTPFKLVCDNGLAGNWESETHEGIVSDILTDLTEHTVSVREIAKFHLKD